MNSAGSFTSFWTSITSRIDGLLDTRPVNAVQTNHIQRCILK
jgi:hypothetical protein